jgi:hypothetical protein
MARKTAVTRAAAPPSKRSKFTPKAKAAAAARPPLKDHEKSKAAEDALNADSDATDYEDESPPKETPSPPHNNEPTTTTTESDDDSLMDTTKAPASGEAIGEVEQDNDDDMTPYKQDDWDNIDDLYDKNLPGVIDVAASAGSTNSTLETTTTMKLKDAIVQKVANNIFGSLKFAMNVYCTKAFNNYKGLYGDNATMEGTFMQEFVKETGHIKVRRTAEQCFRISHTIQSSTGQLERC